ncbi:hypothetical protein ASSaV_gp15 [Abalone shriveling syndrome-associated virus]|uniref:hypothetical protein n=1 Tax=Abalone shriveling syndrome-associated virus TaxID=491893 RepID=UPI0001881BB4|nr:hypothetical protein ASSaV_gp15 [Abalone shriveling syndrome-associated virus]ACJ71989.1 unknown [Abalone shriveling syndrome-associated virus]
MVDELLNSLANLAGVIGKYDAERKNARLAKFVEDQYLQLDQDIVASDLTTENFDKTVNSISNTLRGRIHEQNLSISSSQFDDLTRGVKNSLLKKRQAITDSPSDSATAAFNSHVVELANQFNKNQISPDVLVGILENDLTNLEQLIPRSKALSIRANATNDLVKNIIVNNALPVEDIQAMTQEMIDRGILTLADGTRLQSALKQSSEGGAERDINLNRALDAAIAGRQPNNLELANPQVALTYDVVKSFRRATPAELNEYIKNAKDPEIASILTERKNYVEQQIGIDSAQFLIDQNIVRDESINFLDENSIANGMAQATSNYNLARQYGPPTTLLSKNNTNTLARLAANMDSNEKMQLVNRIKQGSAPQRLSGCCTNICPRKSEAFTAGPALLNHIKAMLRH